MDLGMQIAFNLSFSYHVFKQNMLVPHSLLCSSCIFVFFWSSATVVTEDKTWMIRSHTDQTFCLPCEILWWLNANSEKIDRWLIPLMLVLPNGVLIARNRKTAAQLLQKLLYYFPPNSDTDLNRYLREQ